MTKKNEPANVYSQTKAQWIARFDEQALKDTKSPKYDLAVAQSALRKVVAFSLSTDVNDVAALRLLASKGIDREYFAMFSQYEVDLIALAAAGPSDARTEPVLAPADKQFVETVHAILSALRTASGKAGESVGRVEDAKTVGRGVRVGVSAERVIEGITLFLAGAKMSAALLLDAGIGEEELQELEGYLPQLREIVANKEGRGASRESRTGNIELKLLAVDAAIDLYRARAATATRHAPGMLSFALKPLPRAAERRKAPAAPDDAAKKKAAEDAKAELDKKADAAAAPSQAQAANGAPPEAAASPAPPPA